MNTYHIVYSEEADEDLDNLFDVIVNEYKAPLTAFQYVEGIIETIESLSVFPEAYPIRFNSSFNRYGINIRRVNYKKMAIIYAITEDDVIIHRIMAGSAITDI
jgi:plasmid stabilization system protein ParE